MTVNRRTSEADLAGFNGMLQADAYSGFARHPYPLPQANASAMVRRRAVVAGIATRIGNHTFRATGITAYLKNGGTLENAAFMPTMPRPAPPSSTTAGTTRSPSTRSSGC